MSRERQFSSAVPAITQLQFGDRRCGALDGRVAASPHFSVRHSGYILCRPRPLVPLDRSSRAVLVVAFLAASSGLAIAVGLGRAARRDVIAPEGWTALEQGQPDRAAQIFGEALKTHPRDSMLYFGRVRRIRPRTIRDGAVVAETRGRFDPTFADAFVLLGEVAHERGQTDLAIKSMREASALRPHDGRVTELLAQWQHESSTQSNYLEKPAEHFRILYEGGTQQAIGDRVARVLERECCGSAGH